MFLSTFEKQLDAKRRIVVPQDFRAAVSGPFEGVFCFPSIEADCIEGGGKALFDVEPTRQIFGFEPRDSWPEGSSWPSDRYFPSPRYGASLLPK